MIVAALYVDPRGPYPKMEGVDAWDKSRDARRYPGPHPVVAHPPCGPWGRLKHLYRGDDHDLAPLAVAQLRAWGGALEHPAHSLLWPALCLPRPGELPDAFGGFTVEVDQCAWGHVARKSTWVYIVGADRTAVAATVRTGGTPTHWISGFRNHKVPGKRAPEGIKICSTEQRNRTPPSFAAWLVDLARMAGRSRAT